MLLPLDPDPFFNFLEHSVAQYCKGKECEHCPLLTKDGVVECAVCGGTGTGLDGVYAITDISDLDKYVITGPDDEDADADVDAQQALALTVGTPSAYYGIGGEPNVDNLRAFSPTNDKSVEELQRDFDTKRELVSREIGRRMIEGWMLLDMSCPVCVMPLMSNGGPKAICVLCGQTDLELEKLEDPEGELPPPVGADVEKAPEVVEEVAKEVEEVAEVKENATVEEEVAAVEKEVEVPEVEEPIKETIVPDLKVPPSPKADPPSSGELLSSRSVDPPEEGNRVLPVVERQTDGSAAVLVKLPADATADEKQSFDEIVVAAGRASPAPVAPHDEELMTTTPNEEEPQVAAAEDSIGEGSEAEEATRDVTFTSSTIKETLGDVKSAEEPEETAAMAEEAIPEPILDELVAANAAETNAPAEPEDADTMLDDILSAREECEVALAQATCPPAEDTLAQLRDLAEDADVVEAKEEPRHKDKREVIVSTSADVDVEKPTHETMSVALANGTAVIATDEDENIDEMSHITGSTRGQESVSSQKPRRPKPEVSPQATIKPNTEATQSFGGVDPPAKETTMTTSKSIGSVEVREARRTNRLGPSPEGSKRSLPPRPRSRQGPPIPGGGKTQPRSASSSTTTTTTMSGSKRLPPRPEDGTAGSVSSSRGRPPMSPKRGMQHVHHQPVYHGFRDDVSVMSDGAQSRAESVASDALDAILSRIEECKASLVSPGAAGAQDIAKQVEMAGLIEKLASAAVAVRKLEEMA